jgi:hypothetical protein
MTALFLFPVVLSLLVLGAHFLRSGNLIIVALVFVVLGLLVVRRPWSARAVQIVLVIGGLEWLRTLIRLVSTRLELGEPFLRLAIILGGVVAVTLLSALVFQSGTLRRFYGRERTG